VIRFETNAAGGSLRWLADYQRLLVNAFVDIEMTGFPFDPGVHAEFIENAERIYDEYETRLLADSQLQKWCLQQGIPLGDKEDKKAFKLGSATQLRKFLFGLQSDGGRQLEPFKRSKKTDKPSTDKASLQHFADAGDQFCADLLVLRNFSKLLSSFGKPLLKFYSEGTGAVHPSYFLAKVVDGAGVAGGTATGRLSCKMPNMQQIPKRDKDDKGLGLAGIDVRRSFVPLPGHILVEADQSQVEVRVAGMYAKDTTMGKFFTEGGDFHTRVASSVFKLDFDEMLEVLADHDHSKYGKYKQFRSAAKTFTFGLMFGMGLTKLTMQSGLTEAEGQDFIDEYFATFPEFAAWREEMIEFARDHGWVRTLFGRKRTIKLGGYDTDDGREERIGINTPIQSAAADITLYGLARVWEWLRVNEFETKILGTIHDSIILSVPPEEVNDVLPMVAKMMMRPPGLEWLLDNVPVPLSVGVDLGPNFRDMTEVDLDVVLAGEIVAGDYL
jgi:DNA polymerase-1